MRRPIDPVPPGDLAIYIPKLQIVDLSQHANKVLYIMNHAYCMQLSACLRRTIREESRGLCILHVETWPV